jgi:hypothetical protein
MAGMRKRLGTDAVRIALYESRRSAQNTGLAPGESGARPVNKRTPA